MAIVLMGCATGEATDSPAFNDLTASDVLIFDLVAAAWMFDMTQDPNGLPDYSTYPVTIFTEFMVDVLFINLPVDETILSPPIAYIVNVSYNVIGGFLMLTLIATLMGNTQDRVERERGDFWRAQVTQLLDAVFLPRGTRPTCSKASNGYNLVQVVATVLMVERRLPRCLLPRLGICGPSYGLKDAWYLR